MKQVVRDRLKCHVYETRDEMGKQAALIAAQQLKAVLAKQEEARVIFACAPSQNETLHYLTMEEGIDWSRVVGFHMDEYIGLSLNSDQWFNIYLQKHLLQKVQLKQFHFIDGTVDPETMIENYTKLLGEKPIDLVCLGIGENGHIAFNDPPVADFDDPHLIKKVALDPFSRQQQVNDGCFATLDEVPTHALSLTIPALMRAKRMVCSVPGPTKAMAVRHTLFDPITVACPATVMRRHEQAYLFVDKAAFVEANRIFEAGE
ncbi:glucosamine-6-phosphate deaminase [Paenibacillus yanchengensis]|uniref:Glucosamine-6-phosphate deaminase n=1 Tax=Paenibacillus yanchengensis TaxID=2035833 RepID=A0ABW4YI04_9BACL